MNSYCAISAKIKAMYSGNLTNYDYKELLSMQSVPDICDYLAVSTSYKEVFSGLSSDEMHRGHIENLLNLQSYSQYMKLYLFMQKSQRDVLKYWFSRIEIEFIKRNVRYVLNSEHRTHVIGYEDKINFFVGHSKIHVAEVLKSKSVAEIAEACIDTPYYDLLKTASEINSDYFSVAMMFDRFYYMLLWKEKDKLHAKEKKAFEDYIGPEIDMLNIMWIYRGKHYFKFDKELIYTYLIPVRYRLSEDDIKTMVSGEDASSVLSLVAKTRYKDLFKGVDEGYFAEENFNSLYLKNARRIFVNHPMSIAAVYAYFRIKKTEINNITRIIEGIRYNMNPQIIEQHINI